MRTECFVKIMKVWLLLAIVALLFMRKLEGFNPATERPSRADKSIMQAITSYTGLNTQKDNPKIGKYVEALQKFYDDKYLPDKKTPTDEQVKEFVAGQTDKDVDNGKLATLIQYVFLTTEKDTEASKSSVDTIPLANKTDTGGSSGIALGPTSGGKGNQKVWGPEYPGMGSSSNPGSGGMDSTGKRNYPVLLGPKPDISTMSPAGIVPPSKSWQLAQSGSLPSPSVLGATEDAKYLPYSRTPGDQDLIPDPYRVASAFTTASYTTKTEPVPFLTDFSAFQK